MSSTGPCARTKDLRTTQKSQLSDFLDFFEIAEILTLKQRLFLTTVFHRDSRARPRRRKGDFVFSLILTGGHKADRVFLSKLTRREKMTNAATIVRPGLPYIVYQGQHRRDQFPDLGSAIVYARKNMFTAIRHNRKVVWKENNR